MSGSPSQIQKSILEPNPLQVRRKPGDVPYPVVRSGSSSAFDIWDSMFCWAACRGPSMLQFDKPPRNVLDLGCGSGYWAIETAQRWKESRIYGFDICATQPSRRVLEFTHPDIADRIIWVHGNFLEPLPFAPSSFDFVRIANIGLGVPEDEWPSVLKEVARVMKFGAAVEIIEDSPIFPCMQKLPPPAPPTGRPHLTVNINHSASSMSSSASMSPTHDSSSPLVSPDMRWGSIVDEGFDMTSPTLSSKTFASSLSLGPSRRSRSPSRSPYSSSFLSPSFVGDPFEDPEPAGDPRDHSQLKAAWEGMLYSRFFASDPSAILPFHMTSASFVEIQQRNLAKIPLPSPSTSNQPLSRPQRGSNESTRSSNASSSTHQGSLTSDASVLDDSNWNSMHLGKIVDTVRACREPIWQEYRKLWNPSTRIVGGRTTAESSSRLNQESAAREAFEDQWRAWENDMMDRIGFRGLVTSAFGWEEPSGPEPDWRRWRSLVDKNEANSGQPPPEAQKLDDGDICRSICGIVALKGVDEPSL